MNIHDWLAVASALAAVQFVGSGLKDLRTARRLEPIGGLAPSEVEKLGTVPLRFTGSGSLPARLFLWWYSRLWLGRKFTKGAFLCDTAFVVDKDYRRKPSHEYEAGDRLITRVAMSEVAAHAYRSSKRSVRGNELTVALVQPSRLHDEDRYETSLIPVRARARSVLFDDLDKVDPNRWLEWEIISPTSPLPAAFAGQDYLDVPSPTMWLFTRAKPNAPLAASARKGLLKAPGARFAHAYGSTTGKGFASLLLKLLVLAAVGLALRGSEIGDVPSTNTSNPEQIIVEWLEFAGILFVLTLMIRAMLVTIPRAYRIQPPFAREPARVPWLAEDATVTKELLWPGSTRRALSIGNRMRGVDYWRQFVFDILEPAWTWLKNSIHQLRREIQRQFRF